MEYPTLRILNSVRPTPLFWFMSNIETQTKNDRYFRADKYRKQWKPHFQGRNLVTDIVGYFFHYKRAPKTKLTAKHYRFLDYFCRSVFNFKLFKIYIPQDVGKHGKNGKIKKKICFGSDSDTKIGPWFWFPILKSSFGHKLIPSTIKTQMNFGSFCFRADCGVRALLKMLQFC